MIHQITKAFDDSDERGIDRNIWLKLYETSDIHDKHDNIYQGVIANGFYFDDDTREELIEHLKECLGNHSKEIPCDEYQTTISDVEVDVEVDEDELMDQMGDEIMAIAQKDKILVEAPNMAIEIEIEEALRAIFNKHGLKPENHMWGF